MDWWRAHHGLPTDPKWITVAKVAGHDVTPGHVVAVWVAILDYASQSSPRGSVVGFHGDDIAASFRWPDDQVQAIVDALTVRRLIVDGCVTEWAKRQRRKEDTTATERKRRQRAKAAAPGGVEADESHEGHDMSRRDMRDEAGQSRVTPLEQSRTEQIQREATAERSAPARVREFGSPGEIWSWAVENGVPVNIGTRTFHQRLIADWLSQRLTESQISEALRRARVRRSDDNDSRPVNIRFLACFVDEVLAGDPIKPTKGGGYERGDELSRDFADAG